MPNFIFYIFDINPYLDTRIIWFNTDL